MQESNPLAPPSVRRGPTLEALARVVLDHLARAFPFQLAHLAVDPADCCDLDPRRLHPTFGVSFDWHSAVHMHWSLVRILNLARAGQGEPLCDEQLAAIVARLNRAFQPEPIARELAYASRPGARHWERPYGWAWLLKLYAELCLCSHPQAAHWRRALMPLADYMADGLFDYFSRLALPVRHGTHGNTAFAMWLTRQFALTVGDEAFRARIDECAERFFAADRDYRLAFEPSGEDFLSPALTESLLMSVLWPRERFLPWFDAFLPELAQEHAFLSPITQVPTQEADARLAHLHGLNLSRAWALRGLMQSLTPGEDPRWRRFGEAAGAALDAAAEAVTAGEAVSTHWLASFWLLAETEWTA
ncbi:MAG: DUF2891 family protein [Burkholderiales bacterium]|nr:DUF2891 family protein [Burkholderiales bacterium]